MLPTTFATSYDVIFLIITDIVKDKNRIEDLSASELIQPYSSMRIDMILQFQATPTNPRLLLDWAAEIPAQQVPCPRSSLGVLVLSTTSCRLPIGTYLAERSSWFRSHPVSKIAITTDELPVDRSQPLEASILAMGHWFA